MLLYKVVPPKVISWSIIPLTVDISPTKTHSYWSYKPCKYRNHSWSLKISVVRFPSPPRRRWPEAHRDVGTTDRGGAGTPASPSVNPHYPHGKCDYWVWFPGLWFRKSSFILKNRQLLSNSSTFNFQTTQFKGIFCCYIPYPYRMGPPR